MTNIPGFDTERRECGDCHVCCVTPQIDCQPEIGQHFYKAARVRCVHLCDHSRGCLIYPERGKVCSGYRCLWLQGALGVGNRPDKLGLLFNLLPLEPDTAAVVVTEIWPGAFESPLAQWLIGPCADGGVPFLQHSTGLFLRCSHDGRTAWTGVPEKVDRAVLLQRNAALFAEAVARAAAEKAEAEPDLTPLIVEAPAEVLPSAEVAP